MATKRLENAYALIRQKLLLFGLRDFVVGIGLCLICPLIEKQLSIAFSSIRLYR